MYEMTAYCGLDCLQCPAYKATQKEDSEELAKVAEDWSKQFRMEIPKESILCDGCKPDDVRLSGYCSTCQIRICAREKDVPTCAHCADYACSTLEGCPGFMAEGKANLAKIKDSTRIAKRSIDN